MPFSSKYPVGQEIALTFKKKFNDMMKPTQYFRPVQNLCVGVYHFDIIKTDPHISYIGPAGWGISNFFSLELEDPRRWLEKIDPNQENFG